MGGSLSPIFKLNYMAKNDNKWINFFVITNPMYWIYFLVLFSINMYRKLSKSIHDKLHMYKKLRK